MSSEKDNMTKQIVENSVMVESFVNNSLQVLTDVSNIHNAAIVLE